MTREIVLDTETTGLDPNSGHRVVEIGAVELINLIPTGRRYHQYINPERDVPEEAFAVHGLSESFLKGFPRWDEIADSFVGFVEDSPLVIHNAGFDMKFLNAELKKSKRPELDMDRAIDTLMIARRRFPGAQASLDALCRRFGVDNSNRELHGALLDAELLAAVYLELKGGREPGLVMAQQASSVQKPLEAVQQAPRARTVRRVTPSDLEVEAHAALLDRIKDSLWRSRGTGS